MNSLYILLASLVLFFLGYRLYAKYLSVRLFDLDDKNITPAHTMLDGVDYVPAPKQVLFGHHFASIAGMGPILGPAIAVAWGWLPAVLWIVLGSIFLGSVHDFTTLVISERNGGRSIGDLAESIINSRTRNLFMLIIFFLLSLAMGVFVYILTQLFKLYPESIFPIGLLMVVAVIMGYLMYVKKMPQTPITIIGVLITLGGIYIGSILPVTGISGNMWILILLAYAFIASVLPVWLLLQPRDYLNSFQLFISMALLILGIIVFHPTIVAPALYKPTGNPPAVIPFLFITIACGAISGFHNLVSSGTTAKQLNREKDAMFIGYGGMLTEGLLALIVVIATTAAIGGKEKWMALYGDWAKMQGLEPQLKAFVGGASKILSHIGIPAHLGIVFITVVVVSFALTTLDTATRLLKYNIQEFGTNIKFKPITKSSVAALIAVLAIGGFATIKINGVPAGMVLWQLFGTGNQLLAALGLLTASVYLYKKKKPIIYTLIPFLMMIVLTMYALVLKLKYFASTISQNGLIFTIGTIILLLTLWMLVETVLVFLKLRKGSKSN